MDNPPTAAKLLKIALHLVTHGKCAFCENALLETFPVEHFLPRTASPESAFRWENLYPCCHDCNSKKGSQLPKQEILGPDQNPDPEDYFDVDVKGKLVPNANVDNDSFARERVRFTIQIFDLNRTDLRRTRMRTMTEVRNYKKRKLEELLDPSRPCKLAIRSTPRGLNRADLAAEDNRRFEAPPKPRSTI